MIHYTCDCCKRPLDVKNDTRYVVRLEVYAALDPMEDELDDDRDHLQEINDIIESLDDEEIASEAGDQFYQHVRYDLCGECRKRFLSNPLGRAMSPKLNFSQN